MASNSKRPRDLNAPKRPLSSYFLFSQERRPQLQTANPNTKMSEIGKLLSNEWKIMDNDTKSKYNNLANDARFAYELQMEEYKQTNNYKQFQNKLKQWQLTQQNINTAKNNNINNIIETKSNDINTNKLFTIKHIKGDLFSSPITHSLCHCISRDIAMGKGIAKIFKKNFGGINELKKQKKSIGECAILYRNNKYIYYMITKEKYWHKPTYNSLKLTLEYMRDHAIKNNIKCISMPRIGCGLDKLIWTKVEKMINDTFNHTHISITVYSL
eukprot:77371_1